MNQPLSPQQQVRAIATGIVLWLIAALLIRWAGATLFTAGNPWLIAVFVACGLFAIPTVIITRWCSGARLDQQLPVVVWMTLTALLLDGLAISWFPALYGLTPDGLYLAAATLLWAVGVVLLAAQPISRRGRPVSWGAPAIGRKRLLLSTQSTTRSTHRWMTLHLVEGYARHTFPIHCELYS